MNSTEILEQYFTQNPAIIMCLQKGIINHSRLARLIQQEIISEVSHQALIKGICRYRDDLRKTTGQSNPGRAFFKLEK